MWPLGTLCWGRRWRCQGASGSGCPAGSLGTSVTLWASPPSVHGRCLGAARPVTSGVGETAPARPKAAGAAEAAGPVQAEAAPGRAGATPASAAPGSGSGTAPAAPAAPA